MMRFRYSAVFNAESTYDVQAEWPGPTECPDLAKNLHIIVSAPAGRDKSRWVVEDKETRYGIVRRTGDGALVIGCATSKDVAHRIIFRFLDDVNESLGGRRPLKRGDVTATLRAKLAYYCDPSHDVVRDVWPGPTPYKPPAAASVAAAPPTETVDILKIVLVGDPSVGKTNLMTRFVNDFFSHEALETIGVEFMTKSVGPHDSCPVKLQIWDTGGRAVFRPIAHSILRAARGAMVVYDVSNAQTFEAAAGWVQDLREKAPNAILVLVGNKADLAEDRAVKTEEGARLARDLGMLFVETSARDGTGIEEAFNGLVKGIIG